MHICCVYVRSTTPSDYYFNVGIKINFANIPMGISYIASVLKSCGHDVSLMALLHKKNIEEIIPKITDNIQLCAVSAVTTADFILARDFIDKLKEQYKDVKIIIGGTLATLHPEVVIEYLNVDALCIGDGEKAVIQYTKQIQQGSFAKTDNLWIRHDAQIIKCDRSVFIDNLDELPYPDRRMWDKYAVSKKFHKISLQRGCKNICVYCSNHSIAKSSSGQYMRYRNINSIIKEIQCIRQEYKETEYIYFDCENALTDVNYFKNLCQSLAQYNKNQNRKINFEITITVDANFLRDNQDILDLMQQANIKYVRFGLESGNLQIRQYLSRPKYTNEQIIQFCEALRTANIKFIIYAMYCSQLETYQTYLETVDCLKKCRPDKVILSWLSLSYDEVKFNDILVDKIKHKRVSFLDKYRFLFLKWEVYKSYKTLGDSVLLSFDLSIIKFAFLAE